MPSKILAKQYLEPTGQLQNQAVLPKYMKSCREEGCEIHGRYFSMQSCTLLIQQSSEPQIEEYVPGPPCIPGIGAGFWHLCHTCGTVCLLTVVP